MIIDTIELEGWMPFAKPVRLSLPAGPIAIVGMHAGDMRRSNRAGKTSLLEAITWCLYGKHRKRLDDDVINHECDEARVMVEIAEMQIVRSRARGKSTRLKLTTAVQEHEPSRTWDGDAAQYEIDQRLGLTFADYTATSCFRQGDVDAIVMRSPAERLALVSQWLQQDAWQAAKKIQSQKTRAVDEALATKRGEMNAAKEHVLSIGDALVLKNELALKKLAVADREKRYTVVFEEFREQAHQKALLSKYDELEDLRRKANTLRVQIASKRDAKVNFEEAERVHLEVTLGAQDSSTALKLNRDIRDSGFDGRCPIMCELCPIADVVTESVQESSALADALEKRDAKYKEEFFASLTKKHEARAELDKLEKMTAAYQQAVDRGKSLAANLKGEMSEEEIRALPESNELQTEMDAIRAELQPTQQRIGEITRILDTAHAAEKKYNGMINEIEAAEDLSKASHLALRALASIPSRIAEQQLHDLEQDVNVLLEGTGVSIRFSWQRELSDKAPICNDCGYTFTTKRHDECPVCKSERGKKLAQELELLADDGSGVEEDVRLNSGGTRAIVGSAIRLAASAMLRRLRSSQAAWAIVDEPFGSLDTENRELLARTFAGMLGSVGLAQALVVSHDALLLAALPHRIVINKDGANSTLQLE